MQYLKTYVETKFETCKDKNFIKKNKPKNVFCSVLLTYFFFNYYLMTTELTKYFKENFMKV